MSLFNRLVRWALPLVPRAVVARVARRYVAGPELQDALRVVHELDAEGATATLDFLGEEVRERRTAEVAVEEYLRALDSVHAKGLRCNVSVKPTAFGLRIDEELCQSGLDRVAARARELGNFVRLDMEDHTTTDATLRLHRELQSRHGNVGVVLQAMLRRTVADINGLLAWGRDGGGAVNVRLCKGIYREPRERAWRDRETVRASFAYGLERLLGGGAHVGIATHDEHLVWAATSLADRLGLRPDQYELQMLLGVEPELRRILLDGGHQVRVYVPYGSDWYRYSMRRLRENPTIARHVLRAMFFG